MSVEEQFIITVCAVHIDCALATLRTEATAWIRHSHQIQEEGTI